MEIVEMKSGTRFNDKQLEVIISSVIVALSKYDLLVCDAKEILQITADKIDGTVKLQIPSQ